MNQDMATSCLLKQPGYLEKTHTGSARLCDTQGTCPAKDDQIQEGVCPKAVGTMHGGAGSLPTGIQARHDLILAIHMPQNLWKED